MDVHFHPNGLSLRDMRMMSHLVEWALVPLKICQTCLANGVSTSEADGKPDVELEPVGAHWTAQVLRPLRSLDRHCASSGLPVATGKTLRQTPYTHYQQVFNNTYGSLTFFIIKPKSLNLIAMGGYITEPQ